MARAAIETRELTKRYGRERGIVDADLRVESGEVFGFLGPNGAGKTTTIRVLLDLLRPTSGSASVLGFDCRRDSLQVRRASGTCLVTSHSTSTSAVRTSSTPWRASLRTRGAPCSCPRTP